MGAGFWQFDERILKLVLQKIESKQTNNWKWDFTCCQHKDLERISQKKKKKKLNALKIVFFPAALKVAAGLNESKP